MSSREKYQKLNTPLWMAVLIKSNNKQHARLESVRYVLSQLDYEGKKDTKINLHHDPEVVERYHRRTHNEN